MMQRKIIEIHDSREEKGVREYSVLKGLDGNQESMINVMN